MKTTKGENSSHPPTLAGTVLIGLLGCGIGIGLVGGMIGYHEGGLGRGILGFLIGAGIGSGIGVVMSPIAYLYTSSNCQIGERIKREAESKKRLDS